MNAIAPGWYKDPAEPTTQRYWDGEGWLGDPLPADAPAPDGPPPNAKPDWLPTPPPAGGRPGTTTAQPPGGGVGPAGGPGAGPGAGPGGGFAAPWQPGHGAQPGQPGQQSPGQPGAGWPSGPGQHAPGQQAPGQQGPGQQGPGQQAAGQPGGAWPPAGTPWPPAPWPPPGQPGQPGHPVPPPGWPPGLPMHPAYAQLFAPAPRPHGYPLADVGRRLVARLVDIGILLAVNAVLNGWFIYRLYREVWPWYEEIRDRTAKQLPVDQVPQPENVQQLMFTVTLVAAALWFAYEVPAIATTGQTVGKRLLGIKVLKLEEEGPLGYARSLRRWNLMGVATLLWTCGVGFFVQFVDSLMVAIDRPLHQALHDKSAATVVVDVKHGRTAEPGGVTQPRREHEPDPS